MPAKGTNNETIIHELLSPFFQSVKNYLFFIMMELLMMMQVLEIIESFPSKSRDYKL